MSDEPEEKEVSLRQIAVFGCPVAAEAFASFYADTYEADAEVVKKGSSFIVKTANRGVPALRKVVAAFKAGLAVSVPDNGEAETCEDCEKDVPAAE